MTIRAEADHKLCQQKCKTQSVIFKNINMTMCLATFCIWLFNDHVNQCCSQHPCKEIIDP